MGLRLSDNSAYGKILAYTDSDFAEDRFDRKSRSGSCCLINGGLVSWRSQKQSIVAQSSAESEYIALSESVKETLWLHELAKNMKIVTENTFEMRCDNQAAIQIVKNPKFSHRTKHIDVKYHFIRDHHESGRLNLKYEPTETNVADLFTKPLGSIRIKTLRNMIGLIDTSV